MPPAAEQNLTGQEYAELQEAYHHLVSAQDPRAEKLGRFLSSQGYSPTPNSAGMANQALRGTGIEVAGPQAPKNPMQLDSAPARFAESYIPATVEGVTHLVPSGGIPKGASDIPPSPVEELKQAGEAIAQPFRDIGAGYGASGAGQLAAAGTTAAVGNEVLGAQARGAGELAAEAPGAVIRAAESPAGQALSTAGRFLQKPLKAQVGEALDRLGQYLRARALKAPPPGPPPTADVIAANPGELNRLAAIGQRNNAYTTLPTENRGLALPQYVESATPPAPVIPKTKTALGQQIEAQTREAVGAPPAPAPLKPGVPLRLQNRTPEPTAPAVPEGHTPVQSSTGMTSFKYDPQANELTLRFPGNRGYIYGEVTPKEAEAFAGMDSKGKAWQAIRDNHPQVAKIINGERVAPKIGPVSASPDDVPSEMVRDPRTGRLVARPKNQGTPEAVSNAGGPPAGQRGAAATTPANEQDLTALLQKSLDQAKKLKRDPRTGRIIRP